MKVRIKKGDFKIKENGIYDVVQEHKEHYTIKNDKGWEDEEIGSELYWNVDKDNCDIVSCDFDLKKKLEQVEKLLNEIKERL